MGKDLSLSLLVFWATGSLFWSYNEVQKWKWAGHIARYQDKRWTHTITKWKGPTGKRSIGRPRKRWVDDIKSIVGDEWMKIANNRGKWLKLEEAFTPYTLEVNKLY